MSVEFALAARQGIPALGDIGREAASAKDFRGDANEHPLA